MKALAWAIAITLVMLAYGSGYVAGLNRQRHKLIFAAAEICAATTLVHLREVTRTVEANRR